MRNPPKHGMRKTRVYRIWCWMLGRCRDSRTRYAQRGIRVCERWHAFENFFADMGAPSSLSHSIDRIDNDGHYEPGNCRWATRVQQARNTSTNTLLRHNGKELTLAEWSNETGIKPATICVRLYKLGWDVSAALSTPVAARLPESRPWERVGMSRSAWYRAGRPGLFRRLP